MPESAVATVDVQPDVVIVRTTCAELGEQQAQRLRAEVTAAAGQHPTQPLVLDLATVEFLPSMSLAALIRLSTEFRARQQRFVLAGLQPQVRDVFVLTRLDRLFDLQESAAAAIRMLRPG